MKINAEELASLIETLGKKEARDVADFHKLSARVTVLDQMVRQLWDFATELKAERITSAKEDVTKNPE